MSIQTKLNKLATLASNPEIIFSKKKYLFVVSHMRSRSSVLSHILGSNPDVCGYKELHRSYKNQMALINMQIDLVKDLKCSLANKYLLDKILFNRIISDEILHKARPKILFLLREPESTLKSIINMGNITGDRRFENIEKITNYYCSRMQHIEQLAFRVGNGYFFIESNSLIENPDQTLNDISHWLDLDVPLKRTYEMFNDTGIIGFGDPLDHIKSGILTNTPTHSKIEIPLHLLKKAEVAYDECYTTLLNGV